MQQPDELTARQQHLLDSLRRQIDDGQGAPSLRRAAEDLGVSHTAVASLLVDGSIFRGDHLFALRVQGATPCAMPASSPAISPSANPVSSPPTAKNSSVETSRVTSMRRFSSSIRPALRSKPIVGRFFAEFDNQQQADVARSDDSHADGFHSGHACFLTR